MQQQMTIEEISECLFCECQITKRGRGSNKEEGARLLKAPGPHGRPPLSPSSLSLSHSQTPVHTLCPLSVLFLFSFRPFCSLCLSGAEGDGSGAVATSIRMTVRLFCWVSRCRADGVRPCPPVATDCNGRSSRRVLSVRVRGGGVEREWSWLVVAGRLELLCSGAGVAGGEWRGGEVERWRGGEAERRRAEREFESTLWGRGGI